MHAVRRHLCAAVAAGSAFTLLLAGCSSDGGGAGTSADGASASDLEVGPISAKMQEIWADYDPDSAQDQQVQLEEAIAACMKDEGFDYQPTIYDTSAYTMPEDSDMPEWGSAEFAAQYGYGITTSEEVNAAAGYAEQAAQEVTDPNQDYVAAMSSSEQEAYYAALYGAQTEVSAEDEVTEYDWTTAGCSGKAQHDLTAGTGADADTNTQVESDISDMYTQALEDTRYTDAVAAWSTCMADAGYDYADPNEPQQAISDEYWALADPTTGEVADADVADVREKEIATAVADADCNASSEIDETLASVQSDLETDYYAAHQAEVDAYLAFQAEQQG